MAAQHYYPNLFEDISGEELLQIDLECMYEANRREIEAGEKQKKDSDWGSKHPGAEPFPDRDTMWANAKAAKKKAEQKEED
jgi:hypothetical protein